MDMENEDTGLELSLWQACAGSTVQMPNVNCKVFYFLQGHAEHATKKPEFGSLVRISHPLILCTVSHIKYLADKETDEVYAKIGLIPLKTSDYDCEGEDDDDDVGGGLLGFDVKNNVRLNSNVDIKSFAKTLTQSDANNGGGFSVPRHCAENIYPGLDYKAQPPVQNILVKDVHGKVWKFRHIFRGTPRRHLLTTGWSNFVNSKRLIAGDTVVFLKADNGDICVGIRRAKKKGFGLHLPQANLVIDDDEQKNGGGRVTRNMNGVNKCSSRLGGGGRRGKLKPESVIEAAELALNGQPFEVILYPRSSPSPPPFVVKVSAFKSAMKINWCSGMRFKMAIETEDSARISWFMGTISSVEVDDPINWPNSPWRILEVVWDEPDLLRNVKYVNPWMVELVSNMPAINLTKFSEYTGKKLKQPPKIPFTSQQLPTLSSFLANYSNALYYLSDNNNGGGEGSSSSCITARGIQGARQPPQFGLLPSPEQPIFYNHYQGLGSLIPFKLEWFDDDAAPPKEIQFDIVRNSLPRQENNNNKVGNSLQREENNKIVYLFGKPLLTEKQILETSIGL